MCFFCLDNFGKTEFVKTEQYKIYTLIILVVAFLSYSMTLYFAPYPEAAPANELARKGKMLWQEKNCTSCHQLYGLGGHLGPDLTNVAEIRTEAHIKAFLQSGTVVMPNFHLSEDEVNALLEFLKYTNTTGQSKPEQYIRHIDGTISLP